MTLLTHTVLQQDADEYVLFLHGILGSKANWRSIARNVAAARNQDGSPKTGAVVADLRCHGASQDFAPPHTLATAAADVRALCQSFDKPVTAVLGHSFGGKVALALAADPPASLAQLWVIDSQPGKALKGAENGTTDRVLAMLSELPAAFPDRDAFVKYVVTAGFAAPLGHWLAMNLVPLDGTRGLRFGLSIDAIQALMQDYQTQDLWPVVENAQRPCALAFVAAGRSDVLSQADQKRIQQSPNCSLHRIEDAGHWVHVDAPDALLSLLTSK